MKTSHLLLVGITLTTAPLAAQQVTTQQTETINITNAAAPTRISTTISETQYIDQLRQVYTSSGIEASKIARLLDLDRKIYLAWTTGDVVSLQRYRAEQRALLAPQEIQKVYVYYQSRPLPATWPTFITNTWAPAGVYSTDIVLAPGTVTGVTLAPAGTTVNINPAGTTAPGASGGSTQAGSLTGATTINQGGGALAPNVPGGSLTGRLSSTGSPAAGNTVISGGTSNNTTLQGIGTTKSGSSNLGVANASGAGAAGVSSNLSGSSGAPASSAGTGMTGMMNSTGSAGSSSMSSSTGAPTGGAGSNSAGSGSTSSGTGGSASGSSSR